VTVRYLNPAALPKPRAPFSHLAITPGGLVAIAGQVAVDRDGNLVGGDDCGLQAEQVFKNIQAALVEVSLSLRDVLQTTTYLVRAADIPNFFEARQRIYAHLFADGAYPPNTFVVVQQLVRPELLVEMQVLAVTPARELQCSW
jgi:enamine deaminase RidA (YjgF/YER057c/UK114 family)